MGNADFPLDEVQSFGDEHSTSGKPEEQDVPGSSILNEHVKVNSITVRKIRMGGVGGIEK